MVTIRSIWSILSGVDMNDRFCIISSVLSAGTCIPTNLLFMKKGVLVSIVYHCAELIGGVIYLNLSVR